MSVGGEDGACSFPLASDDAPHGQAARIRRG
jgi:hypothetical protein